jgi:glutamate-5-semialdehyde dehydrogenase
MKTIEQQLKKTKEASTILSHATIQQRNLFLRTLQEELKKHTDYILRENKKDLLHYDVNDSRYDRLLLTKSRIYGMIHALGKVKKIKDPLGVIKEKRELPNTLKIIKQTVPLGVLCVIYESRPNVSVDLTALSIKSGNAIILKGGKESYKTNQALVACIQKALVKSGLPLESIYLAPTDRDTLEFILHQSEYIDVVIPRGSATLIQYVRQTSRIPVIETGAGVVHTYVDASADLSKAAAIIINEKTQRPSVCNALDYVLLHRSVAKKLLQLLEKNEKFQTLEIHADKTAYVILKSIHTKGILKYLSHEDKGKEFLSLTLAIQVVDDIQEALQHINQYSSKHSECIVTEDAVHAALFLKNVDAACVYHNASTRFTDGEEFGFGGEVGISTQKLHARGPMGLNALTSYKWIIKGTGQVRK